MVNFDFPQQQGVGGVEEYVHRIGRTARVIHTRTHAHTHRFSNLPHTPRNLISQITNVTYLGLFWAVRLSGNRPKRSKGRGRYHVLYGKKCGKRRRSGTDSSKCEAGEGICLCVRVRDTHIPQQKVPQKLKELSGGIGSGSEGKGGGGITSAELEAKQAKRQVKKDKKKRAKQTREGDWRCGSCGANVFASKLACFKCGAQKGA